MMNKMRYFMEIKFQLNENIPWHCMQLELIWIEVKFSAIQVELSFNWIEFKCLNWIELNWIQFQLKKNRMQIGAKGTENMLITSICDYSVEKKVGLKKHRSAKYLSILFRVDFRLKYLVRWND